jgi:hypothetical protein
MKNAIRRTARWLFVSAPGVAVLLISAGLGIGYAATNDGDKVERAGEPGTFEFHVGGPGDENLSEADRKALEAFHECIRGEIPEPGEGDPPDPGQMREKFDAAYEQCKGELPENLQQDFEQRQQQMEEFRSCMEEQGVEPPSPGDGDRPSESELEKLREAHEACADKLPEGGECGIAFGGPGPRGPGGPGHALPLGPPPAGPDGNEGEGGSS